jgi:mono/diheme cytochrome c family protein
LTSATTTHRKDKLMKSLSSSLYRSALAALLAGACIAPAWADSSVQPRQALPLYQQECAACHMAFQPGLLPAKSWTRIMGGLDKHYGSDASLDAATVQQISRWLQLEAGTYKRVAEAPPEDRITRSSWFVSKHRKLDPQVWKHASVKSAANCAACHTGADQGNFDDDAVKLPAGVRRRP